MKFRIRPIAIRVAVALLIASIGWELAMRATPLPDALKISAPQSAEFVDRHGVPLRALLVNEGAFRHEVMLDQISPHLLAATVSAEDKRFFSHPGFDPLAAARAAWGWISGRLPRSGASTLTQQLVKISEPRDPGLLAKLREIWIAFRVEREWSKDRILSELLNRLDYGNLQRGIAAASRFYFGKPPADLSVAEAAYLAALPNAPTRLDPHRHPNAARERQIWILERMKANDALDDATFARAIAEPLRLRPRAFDFSAPHFVDLLLSRKGTVPDGGGKIFTTIDLNLNQQVERVLRDQLARLRDKRVGHAAAVVIDNASGDVLALAGSGDYFADETGQVNGAWMPRSPGSALKPFTAALALDSGMHPGSILADIPTEFETPTGLYRPNNYNRRFHGPVSLRQALGNSLNVAAIKMLQLAGGPAALHRMLCEAGITTLGHPPDHYGLGLTLGNGEVRLLELANAYAALARLGSARPFRLLKSDARAPSVRQICSPQAAWLVADILSDNSARSAAFGRNSYLHFPFPVAAKTGTSSDYRDNWTVGYTPEFTVAVWAGNADGSPMREITGVTGAAPAFHEIVSILHNQIGSTGFAQPTGIWQCHVHSLTGKAVPEDRSGARPEWVSHPPPWESPEDYTDDGQVRLSASYSEWLESSENHLGSLVTVQVDSGAPKIVDPKPGTIFYLDPDLGPGPTRISLVAEANRPVAWQCPTLTLEASDSITRAVLQAGDHTIRVMDPRSGQATTTWIRVVPM